MEYDCIYIPNKDTGYFSPLVNDYLDGKNELAPFYNYRPDYEGIELAIKERSNYPVNRQLLSETILKQYAGLNVADKVSTNIELLKKDTTYTICTAHQPNLLTGYLYFIYKIAHAIKLSQSLNEKYPDKHFVPVYFMGSEDNDLDELGTFRYNNKQYRWDADGQKGAVGRMNTESLKELLDELFRVLGPPGEQAEQLKDLLNRAYNEHDTIGAATRHLVNELFGVYGLLVMDPDDAAFKTEIKDIIQDDLLNHTAKGLTEQQAEQLNRNYKVQAYPRDINLFYLDDQLRERIEKDGDKWVVLNTEISWSKEELLEEIENSPEKFSPNVILRGILQERILPDIAFIGGGAEVAYWMQLKKVFDHYKVFYPTILLRQSALWIEPQAGKLLQKTGFSIAELFMPIDELSQLHVTKHGNKDWQNEAEAETIEQVLGQLKNKAKALDPTLEASAEAALAKIQHQLKVLEKKMLRAEKRKHETALARIEKLRAQLFPADSLQERKENFTEYYALHGQDFIDAVVTNSLPFGNKFMIISVS